MQGFVHYFLHFGLPMIVAYFFFREKFWKAYFIFILSMLVDADHLLANPIFDPCRCSIGFHHFIVIGQSAFMFVCCFQKQQDW